MRKILYILPNLSISSGVSNIVMNYYRKINKQNIHIDFLIIKKCESSFEKEVLSYGGKIYYLKNLPSNYKIKREVYNFFENNHYDVIELHAPTFSFLFLKIAKKCNIPIRIVHSHSTTHSTNKIKNIVSIFLNINLKKYANRFFACSQKSGEYWYGKKICNSNNFEIITNGVDTQKYKFNEEIRRKLRKDYALENNIVVGFIGRASKDKNLMFLVKIIKEVIRKNKLYKFIFIGDGKELKKIKAKCKKNKENVIFLGRREDVNEQLNCLDLLVLPSKREGLPMVAVEAQLTKVPCYLSKTITNEVDIGNVKFLELNKKQWIDKILSYRKENKILNEKKFNIEICAEELERIYYQYFKELNEMESKK